MNKIGIRHEDKYTLERRTPLVPADVEELIRGHFLNISVERSVKRIFPDSEYKKAGAALVESLDECDLILGVKEMPENYFEKGKTYIFFSHVIKGQPYNMPMLRNLISSGSTLIDYEKISDQEGKRIIFFGKYAGLAGMINTLWTAGQRYEKLGIDNPFSSLKQAYRYHSLDEARNEIINISKDIQINGLPESMTPLVIAVTGDGNVAQGALEILDLLPAKTVTPDELKTGQVPDEPIVTVNIIPEDYLERKDGGPFALQDYIDHPDAYRSSINELLPYINIFVNGIYWDERYPRLIKKSWLKSRSEKNQLKLSVIGDITCDVHGSVECTEQATEIENPVFVYNPERDTIQMGFEGNGIAVMAVDILPSELPKESSQHFSSALKPFMPALAEADFSRSFDELDLPDPVKNAVIVHSGELAPGYKYLEEFL
jgi:alanine dehydrogenase